MALWPLNPRRTLRHVRRYRHIAAVLMKYGFAEAVDRLPRGLKRGTGPVSDPSADTASTPQRVRLALQDLGPTFVKLGQLLSTRPDLVPPEYIRELSKLQDHVAPEAFEPIRAMIETDLGAPMDTLFARFDQTPIAAGSIAQVHRAVLPDGQVIALKVSRPGVRQKLATECEMLENLAEWLGTFQHDSQTVDLPRMAGEFTRAVSRETDMTRERRTLQRFARNFADDPTVHIPAVFERYCSDRILAMEFIDGVKPTSSHALEAAGLDSVEIAKRGANFVLAQIFEYGLFHSDPHPGNLLLIDGNVVVPLDFGQAARLRSGDQDLLAEIVLAIIDNDHEQIVHACLAADLVGNDTDVDALAGDAEELVDRYYGMPLKDIPLREVITDIFGLVRTHHLHPPTQFTLMLKSLMTIESLAMTLDPKFDILAALKPYARRLRLQQLDPRQTLHRARRTARDAAELIAHLPQDVRSILTKVKKGDFQLRVHHEHLIELSSTLDKSSNRIAFALIIAALLIASSILTPQGGWVFNLISLQALGILGYCFAAIMGIWLMISILRSRRL